MGQVGQGVWGSGTNHCPTMGWDSVTGGVGRWTSRERSSGALSYSRVWWRLSGHPTDCVQGSSLPPLFPFDDPPNGGLRESEIIRQLPQGSAPLPSGEDRRFLVRLGILHPAPIRLRRFRVREHPGTVAEPPLVARLATGWRIRKARSNGIFRRRAVSLAVFQASTFPR